MKNTVSSAGTLIVAVPKLFRFEKRGVGQPSRLPVNYYLKTPEEIEIDLCREQALMDYTGININITQAPGFPDSAYLEENY